MCVQRQSRTHRFCWLSMASVMSVDRSSGHAIGWASCRISCGMEVCAHQLMVTATTFLKLGLEDTHLLHMCRECDRSAL